MTSIFKNKNEMRHQYADITAANLIGATSKATAKLLLTFRRESRVAFLDNSLDVPIALYLVHPDADPPTVSTAGLFWLEMSAYRAMNYQDYLGGFTIDTHAQLYIHYVGGTAPTVGDQYKFRISTWG